MTSRRSGTEGRSKAPRTRKPRSTAAARAESAAEETPLDTFLEEPAVEAPVPEVPTTVPERAFAARVPPPVPERPRPSTRRGVFFDVENTSRAEHVDRVLAHLALDRIGVATDLVAVGNWRVIGHDTARLLARRGALCVHSAPATGVRDWSDLRIAVAAGVWLAAARPGDAIEIVSDDQAFDAVGDVATSLGVRFQRLSYRGLAGVMAAERPVEEGEREGRSRRRRRGGRRGRRGDGGGRRHEQPPRHVEPVRASAPVANGGPLEEAHTAPSEDVIDVVRSLLAGSPGRGVSIDAVSNALKARGFRRPPGSLRLITRLRRIKELVVARNGTISLAEPLASERIAEEPLAPYAEPGEPEGEAPTEWTDPLAGSSEIEPAPPENAPGGRPRRRRRRGGRRRRGRGGAPAAVAAP